MSDRFLKACRREPVDRTPIWLMRQAGRYLPEYRAVRERHSLLDICRTPELAVEVTLQPIRRFGFDAAIVFSDLLVPLEPMGVPFSFAEGEGPRIEKPVRGRSDVDALREVEPRESLAFSLEAIRLLRRELDVPLIGFGGAPFTLASYAIEGGPSKSFERTKAMMYEDPESWHLFASKLARVVADFLAAQVEAGAQAVQLFDSWAGALSPDDYRDFALPHSRAILESLAKLGAPRIHFGTGTSGFLREMRDAGADVVGLDWSIDLDRGWEEVGDGVAVQGNLDPLALFAPESALRERVDAVLRRAAGRPGHIFNLGHGILPGTPVDNVSRLVERVQRNTGLRAP
jgi:uroporphyrinogen decarboxylase